jgi:hypothetical protein
LHTEDRQIVDELAHVEEAVSVDSMLGEGANVATN